MPPIDTADIRTVSPLLGSLKPPDLEAFLDRSTAIHRERDRTLHTGAEDAALLLLYGSGYTRAHTATGTEFIRHICAPGDTLGLARVLARLDGDEDLVAFTSVSGLRMPGPALRRLLHERPAIARACLRTLALDLMRSYEQESLLAHTSTADRVTLRLVELAERFGQEGPDGLRITLQLTQEQLASWARSSRESAAKVLQQLRNAEIIITGRRELIVRDLPALRARAAHPPHDPIITDLTQAIG